MKKGFLTLEMMIAMTILSLILTAVVLVLFGNQSLGTDSQISSEALSRTQSLLERAQALSRKDFNLVNPTYEIETVGGLAYTKKTEVDRMNPTDYFAKRIKATVSWIGEHNRPNQNVELTSIVTNFPNVIGGDSCFSELTGNWGSPTHSDYPLASGGGTNLLPSSPPPGHTFSATNPILDVDVLNGTLIATVGNTAIKTNDSAFFFTIPSPGSKPQYVGSMDNATTTIVGANAARIAGNYAYFANGASAIGDFGTCVNNNDLSDLTTKYASNCGQMQIVDIHTPSSPTLIYNFKVPGVTGSGAQGVGKSIFYHDGYVYLGLTTNPGPEFAIIDVHNPTLPIARGTYDAGRTVNSITVSGYYAYLATDDSSKQLVVLDISNPNAPVLAAGVPYNPGGVNFGSSVYAVGDWLYLGNKGPSPQISIVSIANPASPMPAPTPPQGGTVDVPTGIVRLLARSTLAFALNSTTNKFQIYSIADPTAPQINPSAGTSVPLPGNGTAMDCEGNYFYAGSNSGSDGYITIIGS